MTTENNKIIAEFMGVSKSKIDANGQVLNFENSKYNTYNSDWNWLMEVVEKIESISFGEDNFINVTIGCGFNCTIQDAHGKLFKLSTWEHTKIKTVYNTCLEFIKWYNEQNKV